MLCLFWAKLPYTFNHHASPDIKFNARVVGGWRTLRWAVPRLVGVSHHDSILTFPCQGKESANMGLSL